MNDQQNGKVAPPANGPVADMAKLLAEYQPMEGDVIYAGAVNCLHAGNDYTLVFQRQHPGVLPDGNLSPVAMARTLALVNLSVASVKDLHRILTEHLTVYEKEFGKVETPMTRRMDQMLGVNAPRQ